MQATAVQRLDKTASVFDGLEFEDYLWQWKEYIRGEQDYARDLTQAATTLHIRSRGITISDMVSNFGTRAETQGQWLPYDANLDGEVHPINIVGPAITTNKNACLQSNSQTEVTSANASAQHKQVAMRWQNVADFFERIGWTEDKRAFIFDDVQKGGTILIDSALKESTRQNVPNVENGKAGLAVYQCECGASGVTQAEIGEEPQTEIECPECGQPAQAVVTPIDGLALQENAVQTYDITNPVISFYNFTIDMYGAKIGGLQSAGWLETHYLRDLMYMQTHYPHISFTGPSQWSYPSRCDYALSRGRWQYLNQQPRESGYGYGHERYEEQSIYLHEDSYKSYRAPNDFEFVDCKGKVTFRIKQGQTIGEAQEACYGEDQHGFKFYWCEERLLNIPSPEAEELNFRHRFSDVHWSRESGAYLSSPNYSVVYIQDDITLLNTLNHNISARNAVNPTYFNSTVFEQSDFSKEYIGSSNAALLDPEFDVRKHIWNLPIPTPSPYLQQQMQWLWSIKDSVSQVTPAMRGEQDKGAPYAAQRQQLEQSYGNLTGVLKSFAQCKCSSFLNNARLAKKKWTLEQFQRVASMFGEIWTEEDVVEMCEIDFERDLIVSYRSGSEMPSTPMTKEMKFFGALGQLMPFVQLYPQLIGTDKMTQILQKIDEFGDFDFDLTGLEVNELISQKRYNDLAVQCERYQGMTSEQIETARQIVVAHDPPDDAVIQQSIDLAQSAPDDPQVLAEAQAMATPTPITALDIETERVFNDSGIRFSKYEDLEQQKTFFIEMLRSEIGKPKPNYMLIECLEVTLGLMGQAMQQKQGEELAADPEIQAAAQADEDAKQLEQAKLMLEAKKVEIDGAKMEIEAARLESDNENKAADREANVMTSLMTQASDQEHATEHKQMDIGAQEKAMRSEKKDKPKK